MHGSSISSRLKEQEVVGTCIQFGIDYSENVQRSILVTVWH